MNNLEEKLYYNELFDFYQELLTFNQQDTFKSYYHLDYSLSEIAEIKQISRSAVSDMLNKTIKELVEYENKLHLAKNKQARMKLYTELEKNPDNQIIINQLKEME